MNFLQLAQTVHLILRIGDETPGTQPATVAGQTGVLAEIVQWVNRSHDAICRARTQWAFMHAAFSVTLAQSDRTLTRAEQLAVHADLDVVRPFVTNNGSHLGITPVGVAGAAEQTVQYVPYQHWLGNYDVAPLAVGQPTYFTITSDRTIEFDSIADRAYTIRGGYSKAVVPLTVDASVPMFPEHYHDAIVWWAIVHYYCVSRDKTKELRDKADLELKREMTKLYNEQLPDLTIA